MLADGRFEPVVVETGFIGTEWAEIRSGVDDGDAVIVRGQFLIDSESTVRAGLSRLAGE
jgi:Cu(I)/Ag(I) efflux system membrane fusion protein